MTTTQTTTRVTKSDKVRDILTKSPNSKPKNIAKRLNIDLSLVYQIKKRMREATSTGAKLPDIINNITVGKARQADKRMPVFIERKAEVKAEVKPEVKETIIPKYSEKYTKAVDLIAEYKLNFNLGSAVAHIFRANSDNKRADIKAAIWYLSNELLTTDL